MISGDVAINNLVAGAVSGAVATGVTAPLELVKTIRQNGVIQSSSVQILKDCMYNGGARACFRGLTPSLLGIIPHSGFFFALYSPVKETCNSFLGETFSSATAAFVAGSIANVSTNPLWVVKSRMSTMPKEYPSMTRAFQRVWTEERWTGLRSGVGASVMGVFHVVIQFPLYETLKNEFEDPTYAAAIGTASVVSKIVASSATYPLDLLRTQMQSYGEAGSAAAMDRTKKIWDRSGFRGFFHGLQAQMAKSVPATMITLYLYEKLLLSLQVE